MTALTLRLLGPPLIELGGEKVRIPRRKATALLAYLAVTAQVHQRDFLATLLWPENDQSSARAELRRALSTLNRVFGTGWLAADRETAGLDLEAELWLDVGAFQACLAQCRAHGHPRDQVCADCLPLLEEAAALYHDDFLAGFTLRDSAQFDEWQFFQTQALRGGLAGALQLLATWYGQQGEYEPAIAHAQRWLSLDPMHEPAQRELMALYARAGQRAAAMRQYAECERVLSEELGVSPSPETVELYEAIRYGQDISPTEGLSGLPTPPSHNLPAQLTPFVGREALLGEIGARLQDPTCRLLTLVGPGGSGKTRLALEAAARQIGRYQHGVWFVPLAPLRAVESIVPTIAGSLGFTFHGEAEPKAQLLDHLRGKSLLLVLDNAEHLIWEPLAGVAGIATEILKAAPGVKVLVTSRAGLHVQGEHRYPIDGMAYPTLTPTAAPRAGADPCAAPGRRKLDDAAQYSALKLFVQSARRAQPDFELTDEVLPDVVRVCQLVEGMPLGILLAAAWVKVLTPAEIAADLGRSLDFLESDERDVPQRQRSLRAAFEHSWNLLDEREREGFAALSVFHSGYTREAAQQVAGASPRELLALVDKSLLHRTVEGRYEVHELLQQYAAKKLATSLDGERAVRDRHAAYYATALERWAADLKGPRQQAALVEMEAEIEDARAAWDWAVDGGQVERLAQAMEALGLFYDWRVRYTEGEVAFRAVAGALAAVGGATPGMPVEELRSQARALTWQGLFGLRLGQTDRSGECLGRAADLLERPPLADRDTRRARAFLLWVMGEMAYWSGDRREAREHYAESLALYRALGDDWGTANALFALGATAQSLGAFSEARQSAQEALSIRRALGAPRGIAESLWHTGWVSQSLGYFEEAEHLERECIALARRTGNRSGLADGLQCLASTLGWQGAFAESLSVLEECLALCNDLGDIHGRAQAMGLMGYVKAALGQYEEGCRDIEQGLALAREADYKWGIGVILLYQSFIVGNYGKYIEAQHCLQESVAVFQASGQRSDVGWALAVLGAAEGRLGQPAQARAHIRDALRIALEIRDALTIRFALPFAALLLADLGWVERAVEIDALVSAFPSVANSRMWKDGAGRQIAAAAATLPADVVVAAQERGRARDLWATVEELLAELEEMESKPR